MQAEFFVLFLFCIKGQIGISPLTIFSPNFFRLFALESNTVLNSSSSEIEML